MNQQIRVLAFFIFILIGCSGIKPINSPKIQNSGFCNQTYEETEKRHLLMATKIRSSVLTNCFRNYLKFEKIKKQKISICNQLSVKKDGRVSYVQVTNVNRKVLPKDLKMCIEQEYRTRSFSGLQLESNHLIQFQLNFASK